MSSAPAIHVLHRFIRVLTRPYALLALLLAGVALQTPALAAGYYAQSGKIYDPASQEVQVRGISHFGFNAQILQPQYLWEMGWKEQIAQIKSLGFNAVRVPFVPETLYSTQTVDKLSYVHPTKNADLIGKTPLQALDLWMAEANRQGLYVMLDFHSVTKMRLYPTWFIDRSADYTLSYNGQAYTEDHWVRDLKFVAQRYAHLPYFFALDIYNEPNGTVRWSSGDANITDPKYFWKRAAEKAAAGVLQANPKLLIFVQGINGNYDGIEDSNIPMNWGESFQQQAYQPLQIPYDKLVLSPHTYGPDVYVKPTFGAANYPSNLAADWETLFGRFHPLHPVIVSEWGGRYGQGGVGQADVDWQNAFVDYLLSKNIRSSFYWTYSPNSGDTGGILDDNLQVRQDKMDLLRRHWGGAPTPGATPAPTPVPTVAPTPAPTATPVPQPTASPAPTPSAAPTPVPSTTASVLLSTATYSVQQSGGSVKIRIKRGGNTAAKFAVQYATANDTAVAGRDYATRSGALRWARGDSSVKTVSIPISNATPFSGSRRFRFRLLNPNAGVVLGSPSTALVTIAGSHTPATDPQPYIMNFSPTSGPVGTVVTINGWGFTGANAAWVGNAKNAGLVVVSDTQVRVTIPTGATTAAIGILNATKASFTASAFTVTTGVVSTVPPYIQSFSPSAGKVGTVVTLYGKGFTGLNAAWVGEAKNAPVTVVSDTQARVTVPAGATTGAIGLFNPAGVSFSATAFTVQN